MTTSARAGGDAPAFSLTPPEMPPAVSDKQATDAIPLSAERVAEIDAQVERFVNALLTEDVRGDVFKSRLDSAFRLGREEISMASGFMTGRFMERNMIGMEDSPAFRAIEDLRRQLDELDPGREGDLLSRNRLLGILPFGDRLKAYFRRFQSAATQIQATLQRIYAARDDMERDAVEIEATRARLWEALQKLKSAARFAERLDDQLAQKASALRAVDIERATALEQEVLYYARQNLQDIFTQQAVCVNGYLSLEVLRKTCREMVIGCDRVATTGMSALAVAQTVARATGNQVKVMNMLAGVNGTIENLIAESGRQLNSHAERSVQFGSNPLLGVEKMKEMFELTFSAMDTLDTFRSKALEVMGQNNAVMREQLERSEAYMDTVRQERIGRAATVPIDGPVRL